MARLPNLNHNVLAHEGDRFRDHETGGGNRSPFCIGQAARKSRSISQLPHMKNSVKRSAAVR
jgi:hypothetical protein